MYAKIIKFQSIDYEFFFHLKKIEKKVKAIIRQKTLNGFLSPKTLIYKIVLLINYYCVYRFFLCVIKLITELILINIALEYKSMKLEKRT